MVEPPKIDNEIVQEVAESPGNELSPPRQITIQQIRHPKKRLFIETFYANDGNVSDTCRKLKIVRDTFYYWLKTDPDFNHLIQEQKNQLMDDISAICTANAKNPSKEGVTERIFWLKTHHPEYRENKESIAFRDRNIEFVLTRG